MIAYLWAAQEKALPEGSGGEGERNEEDGALISMVAPLLSQEASIVKRPSPTSDGADWFSSIDYVAGLHGLQSLRARTKDVSLFHDKECITYRPLDCLILFSVLQYVKLHYYV